VPEAGGARRAQAKLGVAAEEFAKWRFATLTNLQAPKLLEDAEPVAARFPKKARPHALTITLSKPCSGPGLRAPAPCKTRASSRAPPRRRARGGRRGARLSGASPVPDGRPRPDAWRSVSGSACAAQRREAVYASQNGWLGEAASGVTCRLRVVRWGCWLPRRVC
jgi:hypothetical protein